MHRNKCECYACKYGIEKLKEAEQKSIIEYGWYAHYVFNDCYAPNHYNIHTHGLQELWNHKDLQCCFPIDPQIIMSVFHDLVDKGIKKGVRFEVGIGYEGFLGGGYIVKFIDAIENERPVLRMLIPDMDGEYESGYYADQLTLLNNAPKAH
jgi:uncharacterized protein DUF4262